MKRTLSSPSITFCLIMDLVGYASFAIPVFGEIADVIWAPVSGFIFMKAFGGRMGRIGGVLNFIEEFMPLTDFIPSFTIAWFIRNKAGAKFFTSPRLVKPLHQ